MTDELLRLRRSQTSRLFLLATTAAAGMAIGVERAAAQPGPIDVTFPWDWHIVVDPVVDNTPSGPVFGDPIEIWLWGDATVRFGAPVNVGTAGPDTFDLGPGGVGFGFPTAEAPPDGGVFQIPTEIVALDLRSRGPVPFPQGSTDVIIRNNPNVPSTGMIDNLRNLGDGTIAADSFFDVFVEIELPQLDMVLTNPRTGESPRVGMSFGPSNDPSLPNGDPLPEFDVLWAPTWLWREGLGQDLLTNPGELWDRWISIHAHFTPEPTSASLVLMGLAALAARRGRRR